MYIYRIMLWNYRWINIKKKEEKTKKTEDSKNGEPHIYNTK